jgi:hypothetical protein
MAETMKPEKRSEKFCRKTDDKYEKLYLLHHMHHFQPGKNVEHELHHCFLFEKKNMKGKKFKIVHKKIRNRLLHCVAGNFEGKLYDHASNAYIIRKRKINGNGASEIEI